MIEIDNDSNLAAGIYPGWSINGKKQQTLVIKKSHHYDQQGALMLSQDTPPIVESDMYYGEPGQSTIIHPNETVPYKFGGEIIINGKAFPAKQDPPSIMRVELGLQFANGKKRQKALAIIGERRWDTSFLGVSYTEPQPLATVDLVYENVFGGVNPKKEKDVFLPNPVGSGYAVTGKAAIQFLLPSIENTKRFIKFPNHRLPPTGFSAIASHWTPRLELMPEIDSTKMILGEYPYQESPPPNFYNQAPVDQQFDRPFEGSLQISLLGMTKDVNHRQIVNLELPIDMPKIQLKDNSVSQILHPVCDTLLIETESQMIHQIWRLPIETAEEKKSDVNPNGQAHLSTAGIVIPPQTIEKNSEQNVELNVEQNMAVKG